MSDAVPSLEIERVQRPALSAPPCCGASESSQTRARDRIAGQPDILPKIEPLGSMLKLKITALDQRNPACMPGKLSRQRDARGARPHDANICFKGCSV